MMEEILRRDAMAQAESIRKGDCTPLELVDAAIARIESVNPTLNAIIHERFEKARTEARNPLPGGAFRGVPLCIKDSQCRTAGDPYHLGMRALKDAGHTASHDSLLATKFRAAGFIFVGRTNCPELSSASVTESHAYGPSRNPWNPNLTPGGSSGGSGAAVASGMVAAAHANDTGGSTRMPASCCGLVGMKPSRGRTSFAPDASSWEGMLGEQGVLTRSVRDNAAILDMITGSVPGDAYHAARPATSFLAALTTSPRPLRIGVRTKLPPVAGLSGEAADECLEAVAFTAKALREIGHDVRDDAPSALDDPALVDGLFPLVGVALARDVEIFSAAIGREIDMEELEPLNRLMVDMGRRTSGRELFIAMENLYAAGRKLACWWDQGWDILLTPTMGRLPPKIGEAGPDADFSASSAASTAMAAFTMPFNASGQPAISLPLYRTAENVPVGVQLVAGWGQEDLLFALSAQLEAARPWPTLPGL